MSSYSFIDTTGPVGSTGSVPTEALKINGQYIENQIAGYRTLYIKGRETMLAEVEAYEVGLRDGTVYQSRRFPERIITVGYQLICISATAFRNAYNELNKILNVQNAELIFADEPDKYFIGTPTEPEEVDPGSNSIVSEFSIVCNDPFKYATELTTVPQTTVTEEIEDENGNIATVTSTVLMTNYSGGYKTYPVFNVQFANDERSGGAIGENGTCGYVLFGKGGTNYSVQIGDDAEEEYASEDIIWFNQHFKSNASGGFVDNNSLSPAPELFPSWVHTGQSVLSDKGLALGSMSSEYSMRYYGPTVVYTADVDNYADDAFEFRWRQVLACSPEAHVGRWEKGAWGVVLLDANNNTVLSFGFAKESDSTNIKGEVHYYDYVSNRHAYSMTRKDVDLSYNGPFGYDENGNERLRTSYIRRSIRRVNQDRYGTFIVHMADGQEFTFQESSTIPAVIAKVAFVFAKWNKRPYFFSNRVKSASFISGVVPWLNHTFNSGDVAIVDCDQAKILLNDEPSDNLGDVGNNWEDMYLEPGTNTIYIQHSDWVEEGYEPTVTMTYRKRWI